ncbi:MAG: hypothetical protein GY781_21820 [Gammaproteobacteria bacterium]|nr:hypothetical protein [Gammaproteobacteria bacterium]
MDEHHLDLLCLTETWLFASDLRTVQAALPKTYSMINVPRPYGHHAGGGAAIVYSKSLSSITMINQNQTHLSYELLEVEIKVHQHTLRVAVVYRPGHPGTDRNFMEEFSQFIDCFGIKTGGLLICGDFNYWIDEPLKKPFSTEFIDLIDQNNFANHIFHPTHISGHILDLVLTPVGSTAVTDVEVEPPDIINSDHSFITFTYDFPKPLKYEKTIKFRHYETNQNRANNELETCLGSIDTSILSSNELTEIHSNALKVVFNRYWPEVEKKIIVRDDAPWYSPQVKLLRRERRKAERKWRKNANDTNWTTYIQARRAVVHQIKNEKRRYYQGKVESCGNDQRKLASLVNSLTGKRGVDLEPSDSPNAELAANFITFFTSKITDLRHELDETNMDDEFSVRLAPHYNPRVVLSSFQQINVNDIRSYIANMNKTFCLLDPINVAKLPDVYNYTVEHISKIINKCFNENNFPDSEKHALLRPTLKKPGLDVRSFSNYRPVSNLSFLSKLIERAILDQLLPILQQNEAIPIFQSAYQHHHSTETALTRIHNDLVENTCYGATSLLVLLDLSAAFDTVDHELLLSDLHQCGVQDSALQLLKSYLSDRTQSVMVRGTISSRAPLLYGVPQGSILGPVLFTLYTSSLSLLLKAHDVTYHFYADDTQIYVKITNVEDTQRRIELLMSDIGIWMKKRKLKLNDNKTEILIVHGNRRVDETQNIISINIGDSQLQPVNSVRNLGVYLNSKLDFKEHVHQVVKSCYFHIRNLYAVKQFINRRCLLMLVHSLIFSRIDYCNALFVGLPNCLLKRVQSVLNRAARLICGVPPRTPTTLYHIELHWLPIRARIEFKLCLLTFKVLKYDEPKYLSELLKYRPARHGVAVRHDDDPLRLDEPRAFHQSSFCDRSFSYVAPRLFNRLPLSIRQVGSVDCFKKKLKTFLFERCYDLERGVVMDEYRT